MKNAYNMIGGVMKQTLEKKQTLKQNFTYKTALLYDSLDILKLSNSELIESVYEALQENPVLDMEYDEIAMQSSLDYFNMISKPVELKDHLFLQLHTIKTPYDEKICSYIIESLDRHGFFSENLQEAAKVLHTDVQTLKNQLKIIQSFEPTGVAAKNSIDALILQAKKLNENIAVELLEKHAQLIIQANSNNIAKNLGCSREEAEHALKVIKTFNPYPCSEYITDHETFIYPDVHVEVEDGMLTLTPISHFHLQYNDSYMHLLKTNPVLKSYFDESKILLANINKRNATMMLVFHEIFQRQSAYFLYQDELRPLTQNDIAQTLGINQTTVSRAIMNKYYEFENDVFPISHLFVTATEKGDSSDAIKKAIREIIAEEDKSHPLSDQQIVEALKEYDFTVSRRTLTKYREACKIPNTRERKRK